jgi:hypothetical protein
MILLKMFTIYPSHELFSCTILPNFRGSCHVQSDEIPSERVEMIFFTDPPSKFFESEARGLGDIYLDSVYC